MLEGLFSSFPSIMLMIVAILGGLWMFRQQLSEMQSKVIATYKEQVAQLEKELKACRRELAAMRMGFKYLGVSIEVSGDDIVLTDEQQPKRTHITTVPIPQEVDKPEP